MAKPKQVAQRAKEIDEMYEKQAKQAEKAEQPEPEAAEQDNPETHEQGTPEVQEEAAPVEEPAPAPSAAYADLQKQLETSEQRYRTLQGMMDRINQENQRLNLLLGQMASQEKQEPAPEQPKGPDPVEAADRDTFGDDFVDMVYRAIDRRLAKIEDRLGKTEGIAERSYKSAQQTQQERFEAALTRRVPNWREIDVAPEFMSWLQESKTRLALVREAMANYDSTAIAEIFELYSSLTQPAGTAQAPQQQEPEPAAGNKLERKVAPSKGRASGPRGQSEKKMWTKSEIAQVFRDRRRYSQEEFDRLQKDIFAAQKEGRVDYAR